MSAFLIRSTTSQSSSYQIVLMRLGGPRSRPNSHLKFVEVPGSNPRPHLWQTVEIGPLGHVRVVEALQNFVQKCDLVTSVQLILCEYTE